ncbi:hypothetical protein Hanom_Chr09g00844971 [Helianthus anomalus]
MKKNLELRFSKYYISCDANIKTMRPCRDLKILEVEILSSVSVTSSSSSLLDSTFTPSVTSSSSSLLDLSSLKVVVRLSTEIMGLMNKFW